MSKNKELIIIEKSEKLSEFPVVHSHEVIELTCPTTTIEHHTDICIAVPYEFNSLPMVCYDKHIKENQAHIYYLNIEKTKYVKMMPLHNNKINGEFEERVIFALLAIAHRHKELLHRTNISSTIVATISDILKELGLKYHGKYRKKIIEALQRLTRTGYEFKDCYYNAEKQKITSIYEVSLISSFYFVSQIELNDIDPAIASLYTDRRVKDFLIVKLDETLITNFINKKGYLNYNAAKLLSIETGIARKIYMYCDRNRWNTKNDLIFVEKIIILAHIIPIMTKHYSKVAQIIKNALNELLDKKLIVDYKFHEESPIKNSWIEVYFLDSRKYVKNSIQIQQLHVHSKEVINIEPKKEIVADNIELKLHHDIIELFKDINLQTSTISLINSLYEKKGIIHIKVLIKDALDRADNYDSYIFTMLSKDTDTKWYEVNQSKYLNELFKQQEVYDSHEEVQIYKKLLNDEYNAFLLNENDLLSFKQLIQVKINEKLKLLRNNPPKLILALSSINLNEYFNNIEKRCQSYLNDDYLYYTWLVFNNKSLDHITHFKDIEKIKNIRSDLF